MDDNINLNEENKIIIEYVLEDSNLKFNVSDGLDPAKQIFDHMAEFLAYEHSIFEDIEDFSTLDKLDILLKKAKYYYLEFYKEE